MLELGTRLRGGYAPIAAAARARALRRNPPWGTILGYHDVLPKVEAYHHTTISAFRAQLERLSRPPFLVTSLRDAIEREEPDDRSSSCRVVITFDDAKDNFFQNALPILEELQLPSTLYVPSRLVATPGYMQAEELVEAASRGVEIGAHSRTHPHLTAIDPASVDDQVGGCRKDLEDLLGRAVSHFAFPYGEWNDLVRTAVARAGYISAVTTSPGRITSQTDHLALHRSWPDAFMTNRWFEVMALGGDDIFRWNALRAVLRVDKGRASV